MPVLAQAQKLIVILIVFIAVLAMVIGIFLGHGLETVIPLNTQTQTWNWYAFQGYGLQAGGTQLLDAQRYATSWSSTLASEKIVMQGGVTRAFGALSCVIGWQYVVSTSPDGAAWTQVAGSPFVQPLPGSFIWGSTPLPAPAYVYVMYGPFAGGIKVDFQLHIQDGCPVGLDRGWLTAAEDEAYLESGVGRVTADAQGQVGSVVHATVTVAYLTDKNGNAAWKFYGYSTAQNKVVVGPFTSNSTSWSQLQQSFSYTVQPADFSSTAGTCGNGNRIEWHLFNALWPKDWAWTSTINVLALAPAFKFGAWSGSPVSGSTLNVTWTSAPNPTSRLPLQQVVIAYGFGGPTNFLNLTGNATSAQIPLGSNGALKVTGYVIDTGCRPSPVDTLVISVFPPGQQPPGNGPPNWILFFGILLIFAVVGAVLAYFAKGPMWTRVLLVVLLVLVGIILAVFMQPSVLQPNLYAIAFLRRRG